MKVKEYKQLTQPLEKTIQTECINYLRAKGYYVQRMNSGGFKVAGAGRDYFITGNATGTPDIMAFKAGRIYFFEVKRPGKKATKIQMLKMQELEEYGAECHVIHSLDELQDIC